MIPPQPLADLTQKFIARFANVSRADLRRIAAPARGANRQDGNPAFPATGNQQYLVRHAIHRIDDEIIMRLQHTWRSVTRGSSTLSSSTRATVRPTRPSSWS